MGSICLHNARSVVTKLQRIRIARSAISMNGVYRY
jgi:hypothetical protein